MKSGLQNKPSPREQLLSQPGALLAACSHRLSSLESTFGPSARALLSQLLEPEWADAFLSIARDPSGAASAHRGRHDALFDTDSRRGAGIYFTPSGASSGMAAAIPEDAPDGSLVLDLSAGDGALLLAALHARPQCTFIGIEREPGLAICCALALLEARASLVGAASLDTVRDRVLVGDGLRERIASCDGERVAAVLGNPPYVGEKGNRAWFDQLRRDHAHLSHRFAPRMDLSYLFMHRALDLLDEGGRFVYLTSEYWLQASGAKLLREDLLERAQIELFLRVDGTPLFEDAPGHHSLLTIARRVREGEERAPTRSLELGSIPRDWASVVAGAVSGASAALVNEVTLCEEATSWQPFGEEEAREAALHVRRENLALASIVRDRQGFVSGADRVTARHIKLIEAALGEDEEAPEIVRGAPLFLMDADAIPEVLEPFVGDLVKPLIRGSEVVAGRIWLEPPGEVCGLYVDGELSGERLDVVEAHLLPARAVLKRRREVRQGKMPWYRLHWPRDRAEQQGPKLVCARRSPGAVFGLDLSQSFVSSDCTYLIAREGAPSVVEELLWVLIALGGDEVACDLEVFGKRKGGLFELYSEPLRELPLPLVECDDGVYRARDKEARAAWEPRVEELLELIASTRRPYLDL